MRKKLPSVEYLLECFSYSPRNGLLRWKRRPPHHFLSGHFQRSWNKRYAGSRTGERVNSTGYFTVRINDSLYLVHRVIWKLKTGQEPPEVVDHCDRDAKNNRWTNLRAASKGQNNINRSGTQGLFFDRDRNKWMAHIKKNGKRHFLGRHETFEFALSARRAAEKQHFGEFAP